MTGATCSHHWTVTSECPRCLRAELAQARAERDALRATVANLVAVLTDARAVVAPPSVRFEAGYPVPAHLRITADRAQLIGRIDAAIDAARAKEQSYG